jgi:predicted PurR-regulated permease PerM
MPYAFLFSIIISITNLIPFIGPYIGGIPAVLVATSINYHLGILILIIVTISQFIESSFIHPIIMSKSLKLNPITIIMGLIVFGYFFGVVGMIISTPLISILKTLYLYFKDHPFKKRVLDR